MLCESFLMLRGKVNVLLDEAIVDFGIRWKPSSVFPEFWSGVRHGIVVIRLRRAG